jgi:hypothetical protein
MTFGLLRFARIDGLTGGRIAAIPPRRLLAERW